MLSEQKTPPAALLQNISSTVSKDNLKDDTTCLINCHTRPTYTSRTTIPLSMTKQSTNVNPQNNSATTTNSSTISSTSNTNFSATIPSSTNTTTISSYTNNNINPKCNNISTNANQSAAHILAPIPTITATSNSYTSSAAASTTVSYAVTSHFNTHLHQQPSSTISTAPPQKRQPKLNAPAPSSSSDASGRSAALERAYVHDVYENCEEPTGPIRPRVAQFLGNLEPGAVVCDVGCGSGRYLTQCNPAICTVGVDRCYRLSKVAKEHGGEVALCDNLELPFRDESFDAVLSLAVVHHFATTERRINALRELARILRIGGRVVITVWALEQRHRRFESQDVLIPWQPPKNRNFNYSDEEDDEDFLPPYHAYTEDSTNSSRSAGDGDSSSLSSSSPGESCYSFVRRAIQKLAGGRRHAWFLDSWTSKDTKNDSSLDYEDAKDLPIELRRLEDFEDFADPPLSAGLKSRSLSSILNPPPRQIVRSRSSVPSLGGPHAHADTVSNYKTVTQHAQFLSTLDGHANVSNGPGHSPTNIGGVGVTNTSTTSSLGRRPKLIKQKQSLCDEDFQLPENPFHMISSYNSSSNSVNSSLYLKSGCYHGSNVPTSTQHPNIPSHNADKHHHHPPLTAKQLAQAGIFLRKQSSLNEELMAGNRIREKERVRKRIQKQISLNEAFLCRSALLSKRLQVIREGFTSKIKSSTGSLERVTKNGLTKIMQNFKVVQAANRSSNVNSSGNQNATKTQQCNLHHHHHHHHPLHQPQQQQLGTNYQSQYPHVLHKQASLGAAGKYGGPVTYCNSPDCASACYCSTYHHGCSNCSSSSSGSSNDATDDKERRHSRESGSDSSKDSSLQSDTSIESEDSFASVIFIPKPEQHQQQLNYQQQHQNSNSSSSNSSSSNGGCKSCQPKGNKQHTLCKQLSCTQLNSQQQQPYQQQHYHHHYYQRVPSVPTSPLVMPCPPTPAHSPAAAQASVTSPPQTVPAVTAAMAILTPPSKVAVNESSSSNSNKSEMAKECNSKSHFNFDEAHIKQQASQDQQEQQKKSKQKVQGDQQMEKPQQQKELLKEKQKDLLSAQTKEQEKKQKEPQQLKVEKKSEKTVSNSIKPPATLKITRQTIRDLPPIPKFRKQQSLQLHRPSFPIVRRSSGSAGTIPSLPKLLSLELFNPATDDLDSDSSEPSSPDSIDSVISAPKSTTTAHTSGAVAGNGDEKDQKSDIANQDDVDEMLKLKLSYKSDMKINASAPNDIILNDDSSNILAHKLATINVKQQDCAEFAEQLSAHLLREIEDKNNRAECRSLDGIGDISDYLDDPLLGGKKRNGDLRDLAALREELRERRLMLANLSTQPSLQQSPTSSSTSSLSSQTRSFTIHEENEEDLEEEEENERSYTLQLYENCKISKFNYKRNRHYNLNPETAYLLQDDGDSSTRDDDEMDDIEHDVDVILEENEEDEELADNHENNSNFEAAHTYGRKNSRNTIKCESLDEDSPKEKDKDKHAAKAMVCKQHKQPLQTHPQPNQQSHRTQQSLENRQSTESWQHSNSSNSLDSPSQGGATTHHRYYHVFREGELDALINHHVNSLHIVSSYYERASWCVVAEKVQVWTI